MSTSEVNRDDPDLAALLAEFDDALRDGIVPEPPAGLSATAQTDWRRAQACLRLLEEAWPRQTRTGAIFPATLGRFELRRELGRGGFGTVYLAHDPQLGRDIALKIPHPEVLADPQLQARFQREARAAAGLDHPNLVPVYETGAVGSVCYIASAYCPGPTLAAWLREQTEPVPCADAARLVRALADAVQHAHERGIIHRDLKPANILLSFSREPRASAEPALARGSRLNDVIPKITDFGLAKSLGDSQATRTGNVLGTPGYMAPEQTEAGGDAIGPPTDVYALGIILYELLTGRAPFPADSPLATLLRVRDEEPLRPSQLRHRLPRDLETICLHCLHKEPRRRYASATALADDLGRFLEGRPIQARPVGLLGRLSRWCLRKPLVAGLLAAVVLMLVGGIAGIFWQWQRAEQHARELQRERDKAREEWERAERNLDRARTAVERLKKLSSELIHHAGFRATSNALLEEVLAFYQGVLNEQSTDSRARLEVARAFGHVADICHTLNQWDRSAAAFRQQIALLGALKDEFPQRSDYCGELGDAQRYFGNVLRDTGKPEEAQQAYAAAIQLHEELLRQFSENAGCRVALANTLLNAATVVTGKDAAAKRTQMLQRAVQLLREAVQRAPQNRHYQRELILGLEDLASCDLAAGRIEEAETGFRTVVRLQEEWRASGPEDRGYDRYRARGHFDLGRLLASTARPAEAEEQYREGVAILDQVVKDFPETPINRRELAAALLRLRELVKDPAEVETLTRQVIGHYRKLTAMLPDEISHRECLADALLYLANLLPGREALPRVAELTREALSHYDRLAAAAPERPTFLRKQPRPALLLGNRLREAGDLDGALRAYQKMLAANDLLVARFQDTGDRQNRAWDLYIVGNLCAAMGRPMDAEVLVQRSVEEFRRLADDFPQTPGYRKDAAMRGDELTGLLQKTGKLRAAAESARAVAADWKQLARTDESAYRGRWTKSLLQEAELWQAAHQYAEAAAAFRAAVQVGPDDVAALKGLAWFLTTCPDACLRAPAEALALTQRAIQKMHTEKRSSFSPGP